MPLAVLIGSRGIMYYVRAAFKDQVSLPGLRSGLSGVAE